MQMNNQKKVTMKKQTRDQIVLQPISCCDWAEFRGQLAVDHGLNTVTTFQAVNRPGQPLVFMMSSKGIVDDEECLLGANFSAIGLYWRGRR